MRRIVWVLGPSGVGKTTIVRHVLGEHHVVNRWSIGARCAAAGPYTGLVLDGPDQLPKTRAVTAKMLDRLETTVPPGLPVLLDGQRFGKWSVEYMKRRPVRRVGALLTARIATLIRRRHQRGSPPLPAPKLEAQVRTWKRLADSLDEVHVVDTEQAPQATMNAFARALGARG